jgi:TfoX/Sxy family transcriptional regulator of competence genes
MPYDEMLAQRIRSILSDTPDLVEKKMFGGVGFILRGNMACGVHKEQLMVRFGMEQYEAAMQMPHTFQFDLTGKVMKGWLLVAPQGCASESDLRAWVQKGVDFALTLPPK